MWNTTPDETLHVQVFKNRTKRTLITMALMNKMFWLAIAFECVFIFLFLIIKRNSILLRKYLCVEFISIKLPWKNKSENRRNTNNILVFQNVTQLVSRAFVAIREKKKLVNMKPQHWHIFIIWKRSNKIKAIKRDRFCHWKCLTESFMSSLTISSLRTTAFCVQNTKFLK